MKRPYSRWPSTLPLSNGGTVRGSASDDLPNWASGGDVEDVREGWLTTAAAMYSIPVLVSAIVVAVLATYVGEADDRWFPVLSSGLVCLALLCSCALRDAEKSRARLSASETLYGGVFERAGISIWLEDWTAAAKAVVDLRKAGIRDIHAHFTSRPDMARELRKKIFVRDVNSFTVEMMGAAAKSDFIGPLDRILPDTDQTFVQWLVAFDRGDRFFRSETHIVRPDGSVMDCLFTAALPTDMQGFDRILVSCLDISEYKLAQDSLLSSRTEMARGARTSMIGALTASISHEVNSPLAVIVANAEACQRWLRKSVPDLDEARSANESVLDAASKASEVVHRTRSYVSDAPRHVLRIDPSIAIREACLLVDRELRELKVSLAILESNALPAVFADRIELQQVVVNLLLNGADAMHEILGPRDLTITVAETGDELTVDVWDRRPGFPPQKALMAFDPFGTTRSTVGISLTICQDIIAAHGGRIWAESLGGGGASFRFTLPVASE
jgi:signal transduction histidine kinase